MSRRGFWTQPLEEPLTQTPLVRDTAGIDWEAGARQRDPRRLRERVHAAVAHWTDTARSIPALAGSGHPPLPLPRVLFDLRTNGVAGMAVTVRRGVRVTEQWLRVNPELMHRYPVRMIQQTIPHEIAHLVVDWYRPGHREPDHGPAWMAVMVWFGRPPVAFHDMEAPRRTAAASGRERQLPMQLPRARRARSAAERDEGG